MVIYKNEDGQPQYILACVDGGSTAVYTCKEGKPTNIETIEPTLRHARVWVECNQTKKTLVMEMR